MPLFDENLARAETRAKRDAEPLFTYYNNSGRAPVAAIRDLLESWFARYPATGQAELRARFRSTIDGQHQAAFFELYLHELFTRLGFQMELHPDVQEDTHPDFLARRNGVEQFYLEATLALPSDDEAAQEARMNQVYDTLNRMDSPNFVLAISLRGAPVTPVPGARLRTRLEQWLPTLNPDELQAAWERDGFDGLPSLGWSHDGWELLIQPIPKTLENRGAAGVRPVGLRFPAPVHLTVEQDVRRGVELKANKYGTLGFPFIVAVNVISDFCRQDAVMEGLLGRETIIFTQTGVRPGGRLGDGAWNGPHGSRNRKVSAALVFSQLAPANIADRVPWFVHHPDAARPLAADTLPFSQFVPDQARGVLERRDGINPSAFLNLRPVWPPAD